MNKKVLIFLSIAVFVSLVGRAQVTSRTELLQLVKIGEMYNRATNLSFDVQYTYADSTSPTTYIEQVYGNSKYSSGNFYSVLDGVTVLQGSRYYVAVYPEDSTIIVSDRKQLGKEVSVLPVLDSLFRMAIVDTVYIHVIDATTNEMTVKFRDAAPYGTYRLRYDPTNYLIKSIEYYLRNVEDDGSGVSSGTAVVKMLFSNYSLSAVDQSLFREDQYVIRQSSGMQLTGSYVGFHLIDNTVL